MIYEGNTPSDTRGCILVGENRERGKVLNSRDTLKCLMDYIYKAEECREPVEVIIRYPLTSSIKGGESLDSSRERATPNSRSGWDNNGRNGSYSYCVSKIERKVKQLPQGL